MQKMLLKKEKRKLCYLTSNTYVLSCDVSLQLLCDNCSTLYYWWKIIKIVRRNNTWGPKSDSRVCLRFNSITRSSPIRKRSVKHVAFADDLTCAGKLEEIKIWCGT